MVSKSTQYYQTHPKARKKKAEYDKEFNKKKEQREKRVELMQYNREHDKKYGKSSRKNKDASHTKNGIVYKSVAKNRGSKSDSAGDKRARGKRTGK